MHTQAVVPTNALQCLTESKRILDEITDTLITKGYYSPPDYTGYDYNKILIPEVTLRKFARLASKEAKRPFVQVKWECKWRRHNGYTRCLTVEVPKRKYLSVLVNPLMMVAKHEADADIYWWGTCKSLWYFNIFDLEFAERYRSYFDTDPAFRRAMKLPV